MSKSLVRFRRAVEWWLHAFDDHGDGVAAAETE
jgi:hypothetical protein